MKPSKPSCFPLSPLAWLLSAYILGGMCSQLANAAELLTFSAVAPPAPARAQNESTQPVWTASSPNAKPRAAIPAQPTAVSANDKKEQLLTFTPATAKASAAANSGARPVVAPSTGRVQSLPQSPTASSKQKVGAAMPPQQQIHSVSALATAGLPPRMASRLSNGGSAMGPSEAELRQVFNRAVEAAVGRSPTIFRAGAEQQAAQSDIDAAKGQRWPQVDVGTQSPSLEFGKGENQGGSGGVNVSVTTPIYDWGRINNSIESSERLSDAAYESLEAEKETVGYEVVTTLMELGKQRIIVDVSQQFADRMNDLVKMLAGIVAVDKGRYSELTQAKARLLQAQALRDSADAKARDAEITLSKLVGDRPIPIPRTKEWNIRFADLDQLLEDVKTHPTILQSSAESESAVLQAKAVRASGLPQLNWVVSKNTAQDSLGRETAWQTNVSMTWGAFRGGSTRAAERAALQRAEASSYQTDQQRRDLEFRIRTADHDARTQLERSELYRDLSVESGRIREDFFLQWHHLGKRTLLDVLSAENEHYSNQVNEINNRFDGYQAIVRQYAGAGTLAGWLRNGH